MDWDEQDETVLLSLRQKLPRISVETALGPLKLSSFEQRRNLLLILMDAEEAENTAYLQELAAMQSDLNELATVVLVINPGQEPRLVPDGFLSAADPSSVFRQRYLHGEAPANSIGIWLSDRFGELYHQSIATRTTDLTQPTDLMKWVQLVEAQCP